MFAMLSSSVADAQQGFPPEQQWVWTQKQP